jgi:hypothetical protein
VQVPVDDPFAFPAPLDVEGALYGLGDARVMPPADLRHRVEELLRVDPGVGEGGAEQLPPCAHILVGQLLRAFDIVREGDCLQLGVEPAGQRVHLLGGELLLAVDQGFDRVRHDDSRGEDRRPSLSVWSRGRARRLR